MITPTLQMRKRPRERKVAFPGRRQQNQTLSQVSGLLDPVGDAEIPEAWPGVGLPVLLSCGALGGELCVPPRHSSTCSSCQVGIQVASEDLCSEKRWNVCKALATFVAHREVSKVSDLTWLLGAAGPPGHLSLWVQISW